MSSFEEINCAKDNLMNVLGDKKKQYIQYMKLWFQMKTTKEDFDASARKLLEPSQLQAHNLFLLQLLIKCSRQNSPSLSSPSPHHVKSKRRTKQQNIGFQQANVHDYVEACLPQEKSPRYCTEELFLPDCELIHMRLMLGAWELGLQGAEQDVAEILEEAVQHFLKNILHAVLSRRSGFKVRDKRVQYAMGLPVPNPWLKNTAKLIKSRPERSVLEVQESGDIVPAGGWKSYEDVQRDIALADATGCEFSIKHPITAAECFEALQIHPSAVPSHGVYSINMERIAACMQHPSWDDMGH